MMEYKIGVRKIMLTTEMMMAKIFAVDISYQGDENRMSRFPEWIASRGAIFAI